MTSLIERTFKITATADTMRKFETWLAFFHFNGGHSGLFAMPFDGDGHERLSVDPAPDESLREPSQELAKLGVHVEIAYDGMYGGRYLDQTRPDLIRSS